MPTPIGVEGRDADQAMNARFRLEVSVGIGTFDCKGHAFNPSLVSRQKIDNLRLVALSLAPAQEHPKDHFGPVLRLRAAGTGIDANNGVALILQSAQFLLEFQGLNLFFQGVQALFELVFRFLVRFLFKELDKGFQVPGFRFKGGNGFDIVFKV